MRALRIGAALVLEASAVLLYAAPAEASEKLDVQIEGLGGRLGGLLENYSLKGSDLRQNVLTVLSIEEHREDSNLTEARIRGLHQQAPDEIREALQPFGYFQPTIDAALTHEGDRWTATYRIDPGSPLRVAALDLSLTGPGADDPPLASAARDFPLRKGDVVVSPVYERGKDAIETAAAENGYMDAEFEESQIRVDLAKYAADIVLHFSSGPQYLFGPVRFEQHWLDPEVLRGYVTWKQGDPIDSDKLLKLQNALADSPYFRRVEVIPRRDEAEGLRVPIEVNLVAAKPLHFEIGAGYGTDTGPRGTFKAIFRRLNRHGDHADATIRLSGIEQSAAARFQIPGAYPRTDVITFSAGYQRLIPATSQTKSFLTGVDRTQMRSGWRESFSLFYRREDFEVGVDRGRVHLLIPGANWERVVADDRIDTENGYRVTLLAQAAGKGFVSNVTFVQADAFGKVIRSVGGGNRLIGRAELGYTGTNDFRRLPPRYRFFAGGDQSVRGYGYQRLGPLDEEGHVKGGKILAIASAEFERRFLPKWGAAVFVDAGNAMDEFSAGIKKGAGAGLRWISPIGPIRIDGAYGFDRPSRGWKLHVNIGPDL